MRSRDESRSLLGRQRKSGQLMEEPSRPRAATEIVRTQTAPTLADRRPFHYNHGNEQGAEAALAARYRYYQRLDPRSGSLMRIPDHVVPPNFFSILPFEEAGDTQHSIITIFSIWNTMLGTAILSMPWALYQAGFLLGLFLMLGMAALAFYTAYRVVQSPKGLTISVEAEFSDVCRYFWGRPGEVVGVVFSMVVLLGGVVVYWVLMSNFLFYTGRVVYETLQKNSSEIVILKNSTLKCDVLCATASVAEVDVAPANEWERWWKIDLSVPFYLIILAYPLLNFKTPTFFTKLNGLGTISVTFLCIFVVVKAAECGWHLDLTLPSWDPNYIRLAAWRSFPALTGTLGLSYFIHNCILTILRSNRRPENNVRDLSVAYILVCATYVFIAVTMFVSFPLPKSCIADNLLNNFGAGDLLSAVARVFLLFQMLAVYPLLMYLIRAQLSWAILGTLYPGLKAVLLLNAFLVAVCIAFAIFFPSVGTILRFVGSLSSLVYMFTLPSLVHMKRLKLQGRLTKVQIALHTVIIFLGFANFFGQFVML